KQPFFIAPKNCSRPLNALGKQVTVLASGEATNGYEFLLDEGLRGGGPLAHSRPGERAATNGFSRVIHGLRADVRDWYDLHRRNDTTNVLVWMICLELLLMAVMLILLPFDTVEVGGRHRLIKPVNFTMSMAMYLATVVILLDYLRASMRWKKILSWGISICILTAITCITMQAARGTTSHFNNSTLFDSTVSSLMD